MPRNNTIIAGCICKTYASRVPNAAVTIAAKPRSPTKSATDQLFGLPAKSNLCRISSTFRCGVARDTRRDNARSNGTMARSVNGCSISISSSVRGRLPYICNRSCTGLGVCAERDTPRKRNKPAIPNRPAKRLGMSGMRDLSHLDIRNLANRDKAEHHHQYTGAQHQQAARVFPQVRDISGVEQIYQETEENRQYGKNVSRKTLLCRNRTDFAH